MARTKKKRILAITPIYYPHFGGAEKMMYELYTRLPYEVDLLVPNFGDSNTPLIEKQKNVTVYRVCPAVDSKIKKLIVYQREQYKKAVELIEKNKDQYVCIHSMYLFATHWVAHKLQQQYNLPWFLSELHFGTGMDISDKSENPPGVNFLMKRWIQHPDAVATIGITQQKFVQWLGRTDSTTIHLGGTEFKSRLTKSAARKKHNINQKTKVAICVTRMVGRKRIDILINAFKILEDTPWELILIGKGPDIEKYQNNLPANVRFTGFVSDKDLPDYYKAADAVTIASEFEGAGITYIDAMASKTLLFAKRTEASLDIVTDNKTGVLFDTAEELAHQLQSITPQQEKKLIAQGYKQYTSRFNWKRHAQEYTRIIRLLEKKRPTEGKRK